MTAPGCQFSVRTAEPVSAVPRVSVDGEIDMATAGVRRLLDIAPPSSDVQVVTLDGSGAVAA
jgi:hypothetical protein